ncbi:hypothetical protein CC80DRAFT_493613 [Byssothecium circinans]|uniref:Uncharacterized protein n=1 Tax=Byssothecium circinans TaxID=147558 RepID=A0A6A5TR42_9PLEO|nr:hypothetical protein CC80DRAFT_493613 [Byssothecium circinans]
MEDEGDDEGPTPISNVTIPTLYSSGASHIVIPTLYSTGAGACTKAPLSLEDDEGDDENIAIPTLTSMASHVTIPTLTSQDLSIEIPTLTSQASSVEIPTLTSKEEPSSSPTPSEKPLNFGGTWKIEISQWIFQNSKAQRTKWTIVNSNGNEAGTGYLDPKEDLTIHDRDPAHRDQIKALPFVIDTKLHNELDDKKSVVEFNSRMQLPGGCKVSWSTDGKKNACWHQGFEPEDFGCDMEDVHWWDYDDSGENGKKRDFVCAFKYLGTATRSDAGNWF